MTADDDARAWLLGQIDFERLRGPRKYRFTLDRMHALIDAAGLKFITRPASQTPFDDERPVVIHVAGTKGKGSVSTMVAAMTTAAGHRTGLYTSPHLHRLEERVQIDGVPIDPTSLTRLIERIRPIAESLDQSPSFFELTTAMALDAFAQSGCRVWVIETGLGGRLDSTNVVASDIAAITHIGLDHQAILGRTVQQIAREKAGIIKPGRPVVVGATGPGGDRSHRNGRSGPRQPRDPRRRGHRFYRHRSRPLGHVAAGPGAGALAAAEPPRRRRSRRRASSRQRRGGVGGRREFANPLRRRTSPAGRCRVSNCPPANSVLIAAAGP